MSLAGARVITEVRGDGGVEGDDGGVEGNNRGAG